MLRCSEDQALPSQGKRAARKALKYNIGMPKYLFRPQTGLRQKLLSMSKILLPSPARRMPPARVLTRIPGARQ